ncbi:MAG: hypothetical protein ACREH8_15495, partial [Opitutaceae bacterium]
AGMTFARRLLENETLQSEIVEINTLSREMRWDDVIAIADRALARPLEASARQFMENVRQRVAGEVGRGEKPAGAERATGL